jgi:hypothetical protein
MLNGIDIFNCCLTILTKVVTFCVSCPSTFQSCSDTVTNSLNDLQSSSLQTFKEDGSVLKSITDYFNYRYRLMTNFNKVIVNTLFYRYFDLRIMDLEAKGRHSRLTDVDPRFKNPQIRKRSGERHAVNERHAGNERHVNERRVIKERSRKGSVESSSSENCSISSPGNIKYSYRVFRYFMNS